MRPPLPSNRSFGWTFTGFFVLAGAYGLWKGAGAQSWLLAFAAVTAVVTLTRETWLTPLNRGWMKFGELLGRVVSPVVLGVIFFGVFTPVAAVMRLWGRDAMCRRFDAAARSYWVKRDPPGPADGSYRNMF
jgi:saxitoxin biosynthesis operon SxtJ-like protein